ncbi:3-demethylubiquinone-9 3-methyltransferase [compost metagenome]
MRLNPYLIFNGNCEEAFKFYQRCLHGTIVAMMRYSEVPAEAECPGAKPDNIVHVCLQVGDQMLMGSDAVEETHKSVTGCSISLNVDSISEAKRLFEALSEDGTIQMPLEETFWAAHFGMLIDRFGVPWMINCEKDNP